MTKADIVESISTSSQMPRKKAVKLVEDVFSILKSTLVDGGKIKISGFGNFEVKYKKPRIGRNPQTGESLVISSRKIVTFKPSNMLRELVNSTE